MQQGNFSKPPDSIAGLRYVRPGQRPSASQWNAVVDFVKGAGGCFTEGSFHQQNGTVGIPPAQRRGAWQRCKSDQDCGEFGIVEIYDGEFDQGDYYLKVRPVSYNAVGPAVLYAGNEQYPLKAGCDGAVKIAGPYDAIRVRSDDALTFMQACSPAIGSERLRADVSGMFLAVTASDESWGSSVPHLTPVIMAIVPPALVGKTSGTVLMGQQGVVEIWAPAPGVNVQSVSDLSDTGRSMDALFLFGGAATGGMWVGLNFTGWHWVAYVIQCPASP